MSGADTGYAPTSPAQNVQAPAGKQGAARCCPAHPSPLKTPVSVLRKEGFKLRWGAAGGSAQPLYTFFTKAPPSKYVGVLSEVWQPFTREGKPVFLRPGQFKPPPAVPAGWGLKLSCVRCADEVKGANLGGILDGHYRDREVQLKEDSNVLAL